MPNTAQKNGPNCAAARPHDGLYHFFPAGVYRFGASLSNPKVWHEGRPLLPTFPRISTNQSWAFRHLSIGLIPATSGWRLRNENYVRDLLFRMGSAPYTWADDDSIVKFATASGQTLSQHVQVSSETRAFRMLHLADTQLADAESPNRLVWLDSPWLSGAFRPQEAYTCRYLGAAVRTANRLREELGLDLLVLGGDNIDNAQFNELHWLLGLLSGDREVHCDSGRDDDPVLGPHNDPKDPWIPAGLDVPWLWVSGNHDQLRQGIVAIRGGKRRQPEQIEISRAAAHHGDLIDATTLPRRTHLDRNTLLRQIAEHEDGHGIAREVLARGRADYVWDHPGSLFRLLVIESTGERGGARGWIPRSVVESFVKPELARAQADGRWVIVVTHHPAVGFRTRPWRSDPPVSTTRWREVLANSPAVIAHLAGHAHEHHIQRVDSEHGGYWEIVTGALIDFPGQMRWLECSEPEPGLVKIISLVVDVDTTGDPVAEEARRRSLLDLRSGWSRDGRGGAKDRNIELWIDRRKLRSITARTLTSASRSFVD